MAGIIVVGFLVVVVVVVVWKWWAKSMVEICCFVSGVENVR